MALTRRALKAMGIDEEKIDEIIALHTETVEGLKTDIARYKEDAEKLPKAEADLKEAQKALENATNDEWHEKYESLKTEYDTFKEAQAAKETHGAKETAYRKLLKDAGISEKRIAAILKVSDVDGIELDENGAVNDSETLSEGIKTEWADFIVSTDTTGADTNTPHTNNQSGEVRTSRAAQIAAEYHNNLYGKGDE